MQVLWALIRGQALSHRERGGAGEREANKVLRRAGGGKRLWLEREARDYSHSEAALCFGGKTASG